MRATHWRVLVVALALAGPKALAAPPVATPVSMVSMAASQALTMEAGSGKLISLKSPARDIFVADPKVVEVRPASANALFIFGVGPGRTTVAAMDADGAAVAQIEVTILPSGFPATEAQGAIQHLLPGSKLTVSPGSKGLIISGAAASPAEASRAVSIAKTFVGDGGSVEDQINLGGSVQVNLRVRIAEMSRNVIRSLGINFSAAGTLAGQAITASAAPPLTLASSIATFGVANKNIEAVVDALSQENLARILAEPNLTAMSGQPASFLAGGEFPIPVAQQNNVTTIAFKNYGVNLTFIPTVLNNGRISLKVSPEVSEISNVGAFNLASGTGTSGSFTVPALTVRRADTSVELGSGQTFAIAGLMQDSVTQVNSGVPFLGDLPVLGALFRSTEFQRQQTELVILVTPYIVRPVNDPASLHTPGENYVAPSEAERIWHQKELGTPPTAIPAKLSGIAGGFVVQ